MRGRKEGGVLEVCGIGERYEGSIFWSAMSPHDRGKTVDRQTCRHVLASPFLLSFGTLCAVVPP